jgi:D-alanyl-D-alanine carboxypeptidase
MKRSRWVLAAGGIAGLLAVYLVVTPFVRDQMLQLTRTLRERSEGEALAHSLVSTDSFIDYSATHPEQVAIACWEIDDEGNGLLFNAARSQPVSHASALLVLAAYAAGGADPEAQVSLAHWERYWLPGTDGGAHLAALLEARASGALQGDAGSFSLAGAGPAPQLQPSGSVRFSDVVRAMVRHADPSAMDVLIAHMGRERLAERVIGLGFAPDAVPLPASAVQLSLRTGAAAPELLARFRALQDGAYADAVWAQFRQLSADTALRDRSPSFSLRETADLSAALAPRGSAGEYARLIEQIVSGELSGAAYMRGQLEQQPSAARDELESFGSLRASEPGIYASVSYGRARGAQKTRVLVVMLQKLPMAVWLQLSSGHLLRRFEAGLLSDDALLARAKASLDARSRTENRVEAGPSSAYSVPSLFQR